MALNQWLQQADRTITNYFIERSQKFPPKFNIFHPLLFSKILSTQSLQPPPLYLFSVKQPSQCFPIPSLTLSLLRSLLSLLIFSLSLAGDTTIGPARSPPPHPTTIIPPVVFGLQGEGFKRFGQWLQLNTTTAAANPSEASDGPSTYKCSIAFNGRQTSGHPVDCYITSKQTVRWYLRKRKQC